MKCDACTVCIGPRYLNKEFFDVGAYKLCKLCYAFVEENGYLLLDEYENRKTVLFIDGTVQVFSGDEYTILVSSLRSIINSK